MLVLFYFLFLLANFQISEVDSLIAYQGQIPNGNRVPHPCDLNSTWPAVGHQNSAGGDLTNPFGVAFLAAGRTWTNTLCHLDSDGDGKTNGEELGDPNCQWTLFATPAITNITLLSHPGICEPITSSGCMTKNTFLYKIPICVLLLNLTTTSTSTTTAKTIAGQVVATSTVKSTSPPLVVQNKALFWGMFLLLQFYSKMA